MYISEQLYNCAPDSQGRLDKEMRCYSFLNEIDVEYLRADHDHADTIEQCHEVEKLLKCEICKNLLLTNRQMTDIYLLLMPGDKPFKTKYLSKELGTARLSFASEEQMLDNLDITPGSVSILGLMNDKDNAVKLVIDNDLLKDEYLGCHPCINTSTLKIKMTDIIEKVIPALKHSPAYVNLQITDEE